MKVELLAVGTELLMGQISNTNAAYISRNLPQAGLGAYYHSVVGDNPGRLKECLNIAMKRSEVIIMTGGLGPTQDDLTKQTVAEALGLKMVLDQQSADSIKDYFTKLGTQMVDSNLRQAYFPEGCQILRNDRGTAPGCIIDTGKNIIVMLPGPPNEMEPMFDNHVLPFFKNKSEVLLESRFVKIAGLGESFVEDKLMPLIDKQTNPTFATYAKEGEVTLRVTVSVSKDHTNPSEDAQSLLDKAVKDIIGLLGDHVYSVDNELLEEVVYRKFIEAGKTFSLAESCTGGMLASRMTSVPGVSEIFHAGMVTYSNKAKVKSLGVCSETLEKFGAVSKETAIEMAAGIRRLSATDVGLSITGIAGPGGGSPEKPVGLIYIAVDGPKGVNCEECRFSGSRERIRNLSVITALDMLRRSV
jgi:nicotinamide-nucleotide amidase